MTIAFVAPNKNLSPWFAAFQNSFPDIKVIDGIANDDHMDSAVPDDALSPEEIKMANDAKEVKDAKENKVNNEITCVVVWNHPKGFLQRFPNLQLIISMGAGVDHIFDDSLINRNIPITRVVDSRLENDMNEYLLSVILNHNRKLMTYQQQQYERYWHPRAYTPLSETHVGILGLGRSGFSACRYLSKLGCQVSGWSRTEKQFPEIDSYFGKEQLPLVLNQSHIVICLLPLTKDTRHLIGGALLRHFRPGAYLINSSRGGLVVENDLLSALDSGQLSGACLDVFNEEPLPRTHPFWQRKDILITPHIASLTQPDNVVPQIVENYRRVQNGESLFNLVDPLLEY